MSERLRLASSGTRRYAIAVALTFAALALGLLGEGMWGPAATYSFFLGAVMLSSWISGFGPGLLSTVLGSVTADYFLLAPMHQLTFDASRAVQLSVFVAIALVISSLNDSRRRALADLAAARTHLEQRVAERTAELAHSLHDLGERVKELSALHVAGRLLNEPRGPAELLPRIAELLPAAWQYPEIASARISAGAIDARTAGFESTPWVQRTEFPLRSGEVGVIEVVYRDARPTADEGPFLKEERSLIDSLGALLHAYFERLEMEEQRLELARSEASRHEAQDANAAKDRFLATLSHELRSPLNVMLGWIHLLRSDQVTPDAMARGLGVLERSVQLQSKLIEDLLDVSRIVAGKLRLEMRQVDLAVVTANAIDAARPAAREKKVALTAVITPSLWIDADPQRLQQVVLNLLTNALKFTPPDGSIDVRVERMGEQAQIVVRDSGIGIRPDLLPRIFDRFQQGDSATTRRYGGLGLGLAIVEHIVTQHRGQIGASSAGPGCGSTFTVTFPLLRNEAVARERAVPPADHSLLPGVRVLAVDDEGDSPPTRDPSGT
jgi:signal transduction histidine kinase